MMLTPVDVAAKLSLVSDHWHPRTIAQVNDTQVRVVKVQGEFVWHSHAEEDELFWVMQGRLEIELRDGIVALDAGQMVVVPRGVEHRPIAREEVHLVLVEAANIRHTGDVESELTVKEFEWI